ncbi:Basic-leucine zipper [Gracilaria domingensis]|nr:Basic-leucine zipper [Gracilaria domingensis]
MLFVCAAMHGPRSVGFEVVRKEQTLSPLGGEKVYLSRHIRDDESGVLLSIAQRDDLNLIEVSYCAIITPGYKENAFLLFRKEDFLRMVHGHEDRFDNHAARKAMAYRLFSTEWRRCPKCGSDGPTICGCQMKLIPKQSMFDTQRESENLLAHTGSHAGVAQISMFDRESGESIFSSTVKSRSEINILTNVDEKKWLATWAMNQAITQKPLRLLQMVTPDNIVRQSATVCPQDVLFSNASISLDLGDALGVFEDVLSSPRVNKEGMSNLSMMLDDVVDVHDYGLSSGRRYRPSICALDFSKTGSDDSGSNTILTEDNSCESISTLLERAIGDGGMEHTATSAENLQNLFSEPVPNWHESKRDSQRKAQGQPPQAQPQSQQQAQLAQPLQLAQPPQLAQQPTQQQRDQNQEPTQLEKESNHSTSLTLTNTIIQARKEISKDSSARRAVRIAPAPYSVRTEHIDANQRKLELRKARNRASAQRSNLKKKLALQKLKDDLKSLSRREGELRTRERMLREENLKLRSAVCR